MVRTQADRNLNHIVDEIYDLNTQTVHSVFDTPPSTENEQNRHIKRISQGVSALSSEQFEEMFAYAIQRLEDTQKEEFDWSFHAFIRILDASTHKDERITPPIPKSTIRECYAHDAKYLMPEILLGLLRYVTVPPTPESVQDKLRVTLLHSWCPYKYQKIQGNGFIDYLDQSLEKYAEHGLKPTTETIQGAIDTLTLDIINPSIVIKSDSNICGYTMQWSALQKKYDMNPSIPPEQIQSEYNKALLREGCRVIEERLQYMKERLGVEPHINSELLQRLEADALKTEEFSYLRDLKKFVGDGYMVPLEKVQRQVLEEIRCGNPMLIRTAFHVLDYKIPEEDLIAAFQKFVTKMYTKHQKSQNA
ncbi:MAG TPA: hypothetical protein VJI75_02600 [Candidatus Nanoarchaeia archaeon]|nr:hypothetical protein [Candidatus Nanoarchaeia archaeon]